jgi:hypothetical protein
MRKKQYLIRVVLFLLVSPLFSCGGGGGPSGGGDPAISVAVSPNPVSLRINETQVFKATVSDSSDQTVFWSLEEGSQGGAINQYGTYTAPNSPGTYHVVASSKADSTKSAVSIVTVSML